MKRLLQVLFVGGCAFLGGLTASLSPRLIGNASAQLSIPTARETHDNQTPALTLPDFESVARKASPAVVAVEASKPATGGKKKNSEEAGSGALVRLPGQKDIFVLTNNHVVADATARQITVTLADGRIFKPSKVWADPETDIAILRLDGATGLTTLTLGDSDKMKVGQWVLAVGSPFGLNQSVTHGIISARNRGQVQLGETIRIKDFLQTDAAINPGSSGGPLINLAGEMIGINTAIASSSGSSSGVSFSIPSNLVKKVARELLEQGTVSRGYLGLQVAGSFEPADALRLGLDRVQGAWIETVHPNTPAWRAGLKNGDVVLEVDGVPLRNENHFINLVSAMAAGRRIRLTVWRDRRRLTVEAILGDWSAEVTRSRD